MAWYNANWHCRKSHVIQSASGAGTDYQIKIHVHYGAPVNDNGDNGKDVYLNGFCKPDFGDIRFTKSNGSTLLPYWMESKEDAKEAIFWVKMEGEDLSTSNKTIYIYYNNLDATTTSSFDDTFIFGDPFDSETLNTNRWTSVDGSPTYTINTANHYLEVTNMASNNWWNGKGFHSKSISLPSSWIIESAYGDNAPFTIYHNTAGTSEICGGLFTVHHTTYSTGDRGIAHGYLADHWAADKHWLSTAGVGGNYDWTTGEQSSSPPITKTFLIWKASGNIHIKVDGTERVNEANSEAANRVCLGIMTYQSYGFGTKRFYAFKIRKYVSSEPEHGSWGSIEIGSTIEVGRTALVRGYASKNTTITSSVNPIIRVKNEGTDEIQTPLIENIVFEGDGTNTGIEIRDTYGCQIRNVTVKNCSVGIKIYNNEHWTEGTNIRHVRLMDVGKGIVFNTATVNQRSFAYTYIEDVGISLKDTSGCVGIEVGEDCKPYSSFIKANIWMQHSDSKGMLIKDVTEHNLGEIRGGLINLYVSKLGAQGGTGLHLDSDPNNAVWGNQGKLFIIGSNLSALVNRSYNTNEIRAISV